MVAPVSPLRTLRNIKVRESEALVETLTLVWDLAHRNPLPHCLQTPAYKNKPKMSFGSIVVCSFVVTIILN